MKSPFSDSPRGPLGEQGIYIPFLALILITLLALCGLVLDAGTLFIRRNQLQVVADLGTQAGLGYRALKGWSHFHNNNFFDLGVNGGRDSQIRDRAQEVIIENIRVRGFDLTAVTVNVLFGDVGSPYGTKDDRIRVEITMNVPLAIMGRVPGLSDCNGNGCTVQVVSEGQLRPANIVLDVDISGSMKCPDNDTADPPCQCRYDLNHPDCSAIPDDQRKLNRLVAFNGPLMAFARFFNPNRDRIGIVPFHTTAQVGVSLLNASQNIEALANKLPQFQAELSSLQPGGNTNSSDALWRSYQDILAANPAVVGQEPFFFLLFSDGADTAGRFAYDLTNAAGNSLKDKVTLSGENDWTQYKVEWTATDLSTWIGPSPLVQTSDIPFQFGGGEPDPAWTTCGRSNPMESVASRMNLEFRNGPDNRPDLDCLKSFGFLGGFQSSRVVGGTAGETDDALDFVNQGAAASSYFFLQQYSHASLEIADFIREQGGTVYAIGLGPKAATVVGGRINADPHQNVLRDFEQKEFFFERLTADVYHGKTLPTLLYGSAHPGFEERNITINDPRDPRFGKAITVGYQGHRNWTWVEQNITRDNRGEFLQADNVDQLTSRFTRVAKQILFRLIQ